MALVSSSDKMAEAKTTASNSMSVPESHRGSNAGINSGIEGVATSSTEVPGHQETPEEKRAARKYRWAIIIGLFLPSVLEALDTTIIASSLSFIASDFSRCTSLISSTQLTRLRRFVPALLGS